VDPRAGLDGQKISSHRDSIPDHPARSSVTIPTELLGPQEGYCGVTNVHAIPSFHTYNVPENKHERWNVWKSRRVTRGALFTLLKHA